ncbi:hypothetical protein J6590_081590 [Homalodisca vitripennis]|nr:hypothetical protein J6590_081590 [Homalodisca vitripennis]
MLLSYTSEELVYVEPPTGWSYFLTINLTVGKPCFLSGSGHKRCVANIWPSTGRGEVLQSSPSRRPYHKYEECSSLAFCSQSLLSCHSKRINSNGAETGVLSGDDSPSQSSSSAYVARSQHTEDYNTEEMVDIDVAAQLPYHVLSKSMLRARRGANEPVPNTLLDNNKGVSSESHIKINEPAYSNHKMASQNYIPRIRTRAFPVESVLMGRKTELLYSRVFAYLKEVLPDWYPTVVTCDFCLKKSMARRPSSRMLVSLGKCKF